MPSINMIAPRRAEMKRLERDMRRLCIVIVAELALAVVLGGWSGTKLLATRSEIGDMNRQLAKLQPVVKQIERYDAATKTLTPKLDLLNQAKGRTMAWYDTLDRLTMSMPESTYLTRISTGATPVSGANKPKSILSLTGVSASQTKIGEAMMHLHSVPDIASVDLHFTEETTVKNASGFSFEIGAAMKGVDAPEGATEHANNQSKA